MKKTILSCFLLACVALGLQADSKETILVNGSVVNKVATRLTFAGDNVTMTFDDGTSQTEDISAVNVNFDYVAVFRESNFDNLKTIKTFGGKTVGVEVNKAFQPGEWATICLPFDIPEMFIADIFGTGTKIAQLEEAAPARINFSSVTEISAGMPYMICTTKEVSRIVIPSVYVVNMGEGSTVTGEAFNFIGSISTMTPNSGGYLFAGNNSMVAFNAGASVNAIGAFLVPIGEQQKMLGDTNGDGTISVSDVTLIVNYILGLNDDNFDITVADMDGNGEISVADVSQVVTLILSGVASNIEITIDGEASGIVMP